MDASYIKQHLGDALSSACAQVAQLQPEDPIEWLSLLLRHHLQLQQLKAERTQAQQARQQLLTAAASEEARLRQLREEEERLEAMRRPNEYQLDCRAYLQMLEDREKSLRSLYTKVPDYGAAALTAVSGDLARMILAADAKDDTQEPPEPAFKLIRGGLVLCGYAPSKVERWDQVRDIIGQEYALRRYETYELLDRVTDTRLRAAVHVIEGVDAQARLLQKHPLGPLATRFHAYIRAAVAAMDKNQELFFATQPVEEDDRQCMRAMWRFPDEDEGVFASEHDDLEITRLCVLEGLNHARLPKDMTKDKMYIDICWTCSPGSDTDVDASLIMFDSNGTVCDSVYHLISSSKDGSIIHKGDVSAQQRPESAAAAGGGGAGAPAAADGSSAESASGSVVPAPAPAAVPTANTTAAAKPADDDTSGQKTFEFHLQHTHPSIRVIAVILNVATDNEDLAEVHRCGMRVGGMLGNDGTTRSSTIADFDLTTKRLNSGHEILLALLHRDKGDSALWHLTSIGELVQGAERDAEPSQNFMNAMPLALYYTRKLKILDTDLGGRVSFNPFRMVPGDRMVVPEMAIEHPVVIGMGWDVDAEVQMDLDCGLAVYSEGRRTDYCDFEKLVTNDNAIQHQGDNRDGEGEGDDEQMIIHFTKLDPHSATLFLYAAVYEGGALKDVQNVHIRMLTQRNGKVKEICRFSLDWLAKVEDDTAVILAKITRKEHQWEFVTIGKTAVGRTIEELEGRLANYL